jgi:cytochrome c553
MIVAAGAAIALGAHGQSGSKSEPKQIAVKAASCAACHGTPEKAPLPGMPSLAGQQSEFLALQLFLIRETLRDVPQMQGLLKGMSDADLADLGTYFSKQRPLQGRGKPNAKLVGRGAEVATVRGCGTCHMPNFAGQRQIPRINGQTEDYLTATLRAYRDNKRSGSDTSMNAVMYGVSDGDIQALAHFLAHHQ